ncbi:MULTISPECIES: ABC transporter permease [unclassified Beijerinckia]|uniref:ABC transporter permease n=1 Tax=unclassified Beijerinckia TaxID=2638183 RepID=UPI00089B1450|nr:MULTISPECIES: ABC transporter permease [unclassified Beijerinckia]MDH7796217.1 ribose transport system permease protein [Beijerinckia sp. GAS462]SEC35505.1 ribose ABC transporter membrane protein [Beijerinckia sp. 28-YEA-48]
MSDTTLRPWTTAFVKNRVRLSEQTPLLVLVVLCTVASIASENFLTPFNITNLLLQAAVIAVITIGMTYVIVAGGFDLSVGSVVALSGCLAAQTMLHFGIVAGIIVGGATGAAVGLINGLVITQLRVSPFIATLASMVLFRGVALIITQGAPVVGDEGLPASFVHFGVGRWLGIPLLVWAALVLAVVCGWILHRTILGTRIFAVGGSREAALLAGIMVERVTTTAYVICGTLAGLAGVMLAARLQSGQPTAGEFYELTAIAAVILGGASLQGGEGRLHRSLIGVLIMTVLANTLNLIGVDSYWQRVTIGVVLVAAAAADQARRRFS